MKDRIILICLKGLAHLPLRMLYGLSDIAFYILYYIVKYRRKVVRQNLSSSFPLKDEAWIKKVEKDFYHFLGDQIVETLKLLHISNLELKRRVKVVNYNDINETLEKGQSAVVLLGHYSNWEWVQEISGYFLDSAYKVSIYHKLKNPFWDKVFQDLRSRWGRHIIPQKKAARNLLDPANQPWVCGFIADAYTGRKHDDNWVEFLNHKTWFIYGPEEIGDRVGADYFFLKMQRVKRGYYEISFQKIIPGEEDRRENYPHLRIFWKLFQEEIEQAPAYWLWSHRRWK